MGALASLCSAAQHRTQLAVLACNILWRVSETLLVALCCAVVCSDVLCSHMTPLLCLYPPTRAPVPQLISEFQAFKHMECIAPGTIQKASSPLEVTLSVQPTLVLQNALPYEMRVLLWQHLPVAPVDSGALPSTSLDGLLAARLSPVSLLGQQQHQCLCSQLVPSSRATARARSA